MQITDTDLTGKKENTKIVKKKKNITPSLSLIM